MKLFIMTRDINGSVTYLRQPSDSVYQTSLLADTELTLTVPKSEFTNGKRMIAIFSYEAGSDVWVNVNATAMTPTSGTFTSGHGEHNPVGYEVKTGDVLHFITNQDAVMLSVAFYEINPNV